MPTLPRGPQKAGITFCRGSAAASQVFLTQQYVDDRLSNLQAAGGYLGILYLRVCVFLLVPVPVQMSEIV